MAIIGSVVDIIKGMKDIMGIKVQIVRKRLHKDYIKII